MDGLEFRKRGREMVDYIVDYLDNIDARRVTPNIEPGYLQDLIPPGIVTRFLHIFNVANPEYFTIPVRVCPTLNS